LRSYKAIAFISSDPTSLIEKLICYLKLGAPSGSTVLTKQKTLSSFSKNLGE